MLKQLRRLASRALPEALALRWRARKANPLVTIVVPCYNVSKYLPEAVKSLRNQTYRNLEVLLINDGSSDDTLAVARAHTKKDPRFKVLTQKNQGLSATRNRGISLAKGKYIWFIDSDDRIPHHAINTFVSTLEQTGSDFAVGNYNRFNSSRTWGAAFWIRQEHLDTAYQQTLTTRPSALVNAIACSKMFRVDFLRNNEINFPVGVTYEDQPVTAKAYALASTFDVLPQIIYNWRDREDGTSISQQTDSTADLQSRLHAAFSSLKVLSDLANDRIANIRRVQLVSNDLPTSTATIQTAGIEYWDTLVEGTRKLIANQRDHVLSETPPNHAALTHFILENDRESAIEHLEVYGTDINRYYSEYSGGKVYGFMPHLEKLFTEHPSLAQFPERYLVQYAGLEDMSVDQHGNLVIEGWSFISRLSADRYPYSQTLIIRSETLETPLEFRCVGIGTDTPDFFSKHERNDYRETGFRALIPLETLREIGAKELTITIRTECCGIAREQRVTRSRNSRYFASPTFIGSSEGRCKVKISKKGDALHLETAKFDFSLTDISEIEDAIRIDFLSSSGLSAEKLHLYDKNTGLAFFYPVQESFGRFFAYISKNELEELTTNNAVVLRVITDTGHTRPIFWPSEPYPQISLALVNKFRGYRAKSGNLSIQRHIEDEVVIDKLALAEGCLRIRGVLRGNKSETKLVIRNHSINREILLPDSGEFDLTIALKFDHWGTDTRLPNGKFMVYFTQEDGESVSKMRLVLPEVLLHSLPLESRNESRDELLRVFHFNDWNLQLQVHTLSGPENASRREHSQRIDRYISTSEPVQPGLWLLRSYYGESVSCVPAAIGRYVSKNLEGTTVYAAVTDHSVPVPTGIRPVIHESREWYELLATAEYYIDNTHQPIYFEKKSGQKVVATFHGYPFKICGVPLWEQMRLSANRVASFHKRHAQWDVLVSPAPYATPLLQQVFPSPAQIAEVGYARNDFFASSNIAAIRNSVRETLGILPGQKAVLYAPTFRDYLAIDEWRAKLPDFLSPSEFLAEMPEDYVLLVRGHAYNKRLDNRVGSSNRVIDVTDYPEINELSIASDAAVLDYSSLRFDYALTGNPMIFLVPDKELYLEGSRGGLIDYDPTAPGPQVSSTGEVCAYLRDLETLRAEWKQKYSDFLETYLPLEDGNAAQRTVEFILNATEPTS